MLAIAESGIRKVQGNAVSVSFRKVGFGTVPPTTDLISLQEGPPEHFCFANRVASLQVGQHKREYHEWGYCMN